MPRPALIVGLGGTGQWVLTWLKRDLLLSNNGKVPDNIKLLSIDTATQLEAGAERVTASGAKEEGVALGDVSLEKGEFIYIGGDARPLANEIRAGEWPQIANWFQAQRWLSTQAPATFVLDDGAGRIRQFGRLAVFKDIIGQETGSILWRAFRSALQSVQARTSYDRRLEIIVVGSFAGGTGSGMFLDTALILRMLAQEANIHHVLRGFFALPSVFTNAPDADMQARTFAAWRELNRFMVVNPDFPMPLVEYVEDNPSFRIRPDQRIFDACYLIDGRRQGQPIADEAKYGVFPMTAEVISAILDEDAGRAYTQWIFTNLAPEYAKNPDTPLYSAVGAYTVQVPAHFVQEISSHALAQRVLLDLLKPNQEPDQYEQLVSTGAERHLRLAASNRNQEDKGFAGRQRSRRTLTEGIVYGGQSAKPTLFSGRIADLLQQAYDANQLPQVVDRLARTGGSAPGQAVARDSWLAFFPDLGEDPTFAATRQQVEEHVRFSIFAAFGPQEGEKEDERRVKFRKIPDELRVRFGGVTSTGEEIDTFYGSFGEALIEVQRVQLILFRRLLRLYMLDVLMGRSDDPLLARTGKLGYAWDYFDGLSTELGRFLNLMDQVRQRRNDPQVKNEVRLAGLSKRARQMMEATSGKRLFWLWEHPNVKGSEREYLAAQQRLMDVRREDILHVFVVQTAEMMKAAAEEARDALQFWIWHLSTGDDASGLPGIWDGVRDSKQGVQNAHGFDQRTPKVQKLLADEPVQLDEAEVAKALSRWEWDVDYAGSPPRLQVSVRLLPEIEGGETTTLVDLSTAASPQIRFDLSRKNQHRFLNLARRSFAGVVARTTVTQAIRETYPNPNDFTNQVASISAEPLFAGRSGANPRKKSNLIRVMADERDPYFGSAGLVRRLREINQLDPNILDDTYGIQIVNSEHPYKLTLVRTDDLYSYDAFAAWREALAAYRKHVTGDGNLLEPALLQNFSAEARAVVYEQRLTEDPFRREYEPLHPRVVMLLDDTDALRQFLYLGMFGMIQEVDARDTYRWELTWAKMHGTQTFWLTRPWSLSQDSGQRPRPDILNAMHGYVVMRKTWQLGRRDFIDFQLAQRLIDDELERRGKKDELKLIDSNLNGGFVGFLHELARDPEVPDRILRRDFEDMALVAHLILEDRRQQLIRESERKAASGSSHGRSPFKVWSDVEPDTDNAEDEVASGQETRRNVFGGGE